MLFVLFALTGVSPSASQKPKITQEIHHCQVQAVLPEQKSVQAMKSPQAILCVLARALKRHGRFSARQNRVCPCQLMVRSILFSPFLFRAPGHWARGKFYVYALIAPSSARRTGCQSRWYKKETAEAVSFLYEIISRSRKAGARSDVLSL